VRFLRKGTNESSAEMIEKVEFASFRSGAHDIVPFCGVLPCATKVLENRAAAFFTLAAKQEDMSCNFKIFPKSHYL
jgi:hypothetical protein